MAEAHGPGSHDHQGWSGFQAFRCSAQQSPVMVLPILSFLVFSSEARALHLQSRLPNSPAGVLTSQVSAAVCGWARNVAVIILGSLKCLRSVCGWGVKGCRRKPGRHTYRECLGPQALAVHMVSGLGTQHWDRTAGPSRGCGNRHLTHS